MFKWIKKLFPGNNIAKKEDEIVPEIIVDTPVREMKFVWSVVGNIVNQHYHGENKEIKYGTKYFLPNTKLYCFPPLWGDGYADIKVIGRHRKTKRYITLVMPSALITNWRLEKVYSPYIIKEMSKEIGWTDSEDDQESIKQLVASLNRRAE